jgi:Bacterial Ig domain
MKNHTLILRLFAAPLKATSRGIRNAAFAIALLLVSAQLSSAQVTVTATNDDGVPTATKKNPGDTVVYTIQINSTGASAATGVTLTDPTAANTSEVAGSLNATPVALDDTYPQTVQANQTVNTATSGFTVVTNDYPGILAGNPVALSALAITTFDAASLNGGIVTMTPSGANVGRFTYAAPPGFTGTDSFTYTITNGVAGTPVGSNVGKVTITVAGPVIWFVDDSAPAGGNGTWTGTNSKAFQTVAQAAAVDLANHRIYLASGTYTNGIVLNTGEWVVGEGAVGTTFDALMGITPGTDTPARPGINGTKPAWSAAAASSVVTLADNDTILGVAITGNSVAAMTGTGVNTGLIGNATTTDTTITGVAGGGFALSGGSGAIGMNATISTSLNGRSVSISGRGAGIVTFSRSITETGGGGVFLDNNDSSGIATFTFTGGLSLSTGGNAAFTATNGGIVNATQDNTTIVNTLTTSTGTALNVANTTIGASNLTFRSITSNGATNGIILNTTGATGGLIVSGNAGTCSSVATCTGGAIQSSVTGVSLNSTTGVSIDRMLIQTATDSGVSGVGVTNFTFTNGKIDSTGNANFDSCISFNGNGTGLGNNIAGTLTITGNTLTNAYYSGVDVQGDNGTVTNANISNNTITNTTVGVGINFNGQNNASTAFNLQNATINQNNISGIAGTGIQAQCSSSNLTGPGASCGTPGDGTKLISITNNSVLLQPTATQGITITSTGGNSGSRAKGNFLVQCNGRNTGGCTAPTGTALGSSSQGTVILIGNNGFADMAATINNNTVLATHTPNLGGGNGIAGGNGVAGAGNAWTPQLTLSVTNNIVNGTDGNMILLVGRGTSGFANMKVTGNTVGTPNNPGGTAREGIRIDAGNAASADDGVCVTLSGNTCAIGSNGAAGIGIRKQGTVQTTNDFGLTGLAPSP